MSKKPLDFTKKCLGIIFLSTFLCMPINTLIASSKGFDFVDDIQFGNPIYPKLQEMTTLKIREIHKFIEVVHSEIRIRYNVSIDRSKALELVRQNIANSHEFSSEQKHQFGIICDLVEKKTNPQKLKWTFLALNTNGNPITDNNLEFELPAKMATGYMLMLGGALCMFVPGGQGVGTFLIATGAALAFDGLANGEVPYNIDRSGNRYNINTGKRID